MTLVEILSILILVGVLAAIVLLVMLILQTRRSRNVAEPAADEEDIAAATGFGDLSLYSRVFKQNLGVSPAAFRKE